MIDNGSDSGLLPRHNIQLYRFFLHLRPDRIGEYTVAGKIDHAVNRFHFITHGRVIDRSIDQVQLAFYVQSLRMEEWDIQLQAQQAFPVYLEQAQGTPQPPVQWTVPDIVLHVGIITAGLQVYAEHGVVKIGDFCDGIIKPDTTADRTGVGQYQALVFKLHDTRSLLQFRPVFQVQHIHIPGFKHHLEYAVMLLERKIRQITIKNKLPLRHITVGNGHVQPVDQLRFHYAYRQIACCVFAPGIIKVCLRVDKNLFVRLQSQVKTRESINVIVFQLQAVRCQPPALFRATHFKFALQKIRL